MKTTAQINDGLPMDSDPKMPGGEDRHGQAGNMRQVQHGQDHYKTHPGGLENDMGGPSRAKAKEMLKDGTAHGRPLTSAQRGYFGVIASGKKPRNG